MADVKIGPPKTTTTTPTQTKTIYKQTPADAAAAKAANFPTSLSGVGQTYEAQFNKGQLEQANLGRFYDWVGQQQAAQMGPMYGGNNGGGGRGGGGGGGGGPSPEQLRAIAGELYQVNPGPYFQQQAALDNQRAQAAAYNPDFAGMQATAMAGGQQAAAARRAAIEAQQQQMVGVGQQLAGQNATAMAGAARDLGAQGVALQPYMQQANQMGANATAGLSNQAQYMGQLNAAGELGLENFSQGTGLIRQGGEAGLANNRGQLYNQLDQQTAAIQMAAAQQQQQMDQAKREFLLKYGIV